MGDDQGLPLEQIKETEEEENCSAAPVSHHKMHEEVSTNTNYANGINEIQMNHQLQQNPHFGSINKSNRHASMIVVSDGSSGLVLNNNNPAIAVDTSSSHFQN